MKISYNWLSDYIDIPEEMSIKEVADLLTDIGLEVEGLHEYEVVEGGLNGLVVGKVESVVPHPDADRLRVTTVNVGAEELLNIVCGAPNVAEGQHVVVATIGAVLYPKDGDGFKIKKSKIRGILSEGMICAEDEIGLGESHEGIMVLTDQPKVGTPAAEYFNLQSDQIIEIGLTPNRSDAFSHIGVARDLQAALKFRNNYKGDLNLPNLTDFKEGNDHALKVEVVDTIGAPRYAGVVIDDVKIGPSPQWMQDRLTAIGLRPINNVVDVTNYVMYEFGQPLHAFDMATVGNKVIVKNLAEGSKFKTLDETERTLSSHDLMICNANTGMCIAGVFGGMDSGVSETTSSIFLESAYFDAKTIRKTSTTHGLRTDAAAHFEKGVDPEMVIPALKRAALLIQELAGGKVVSKIYDLKSDEFAPFEVTLDKVQLDKVAGITVEESTIQEILELLEIEVKSKNGSVYELAVPQYRYDVRRECDVIEDILRIYGFNNLPIPDTLHASIMAIDSKDDSQFYNRIADYLVGLGFSEIMTNSIAKSQFLTEKEQGQKVSLLNSLNVDLNVMRANMLYPMLEVVAHNLNHFNENLRFFELGKTYLKKEENYEESRNLSLIISGNQQKKNWRIKENAADFFYLRSVVENILNKLNINHFNIENPKERSENAKSELSYVARKQTLASIIEVNKKVLKQFDIKEKVYYLNIYWDKVLEMSKNSRFKLKEISKFPKIRRDLALLLNEKLNFKEIETIAAKIGGQRLKDIDLFDVYTDDKIGADKKSYAVSFVFSDLNKTLTDKEVDGIMNKLIQSFEKELGAQIR